MAQVLAEQTTKKKKSVAVAMRQPKKKQKKKRTDGMFGLFATQVDQHIGGAQEGEEEAPRPRQKDPLRNKIRESIPELNLRKVMLWFLLAEIDPEYGQHPRNTGLCDASHYMRVQVKDSIFWVGVFFNLLFFCMRHLGSSPGASLLWLHPRVVVTWGITDVALAPGDLFTVMPRVGPTPPRARATVLSTPAGRDRPEAGTQREVPTPGTPPLGRTGA